MKLHAPVNDTCRESWCGPTALSIISGRPMSQFMPAGRRGGMMVAEVLMHLHAMQYRTTVVRFPRRTSRKRIARALPPNGFGIISGGGHYMAFSGKLLRCPMVDRPTWAYDHPWGGRFARTLILVEKK